MLALASAAVVDHARSARRQSKGTGPGLVPLRTHPRNWGDGGVHGLPPLPDKVSVGSSLKARSAPGIFSGLSFAVLGCPLLLLHGQARSAIVGVGVVQRWRSCRGIHWGVERAGGLGVGSWLATAPVLPNPCHLRSAQSGDISKFTHGPFHIGDGQQVYHLWGGGGAKR